MKLATRIASISALAALPFAFSAACVTRVDGVCDFRNACEGDGDGGSLDGGGDALVPPGCASGKDPKDDAACVTDGKGVFVKAGAVGGNGTKAKPFGTVGEGVAKAAGKAVFVCEGSYAEALELSGAVAIYGGFDCATFAHAGKRSTLASPKATAVTVSSGAAVVLQDWTIVASDGAGPGGSSIGVFASGAQSVQIARSEIKAGKGQAGAAGAPGADGQAGEPGKSPVGNAGGDPGVRDCGGGVTSTGGAGGAVAGGPTYFAGTDGKSTPEMYVETTPAFTGAGGSAYDNGNQALGGRPGKNGAPGTDLGMPAESDGDLTAAGWAASTGKPGGKGFVAQGGGGGGAGGSDGSGGPGGGGGSGGCGGSGGAGGAAGGSSVALLSFNATLTLVDTKLSTAEAGIGGMGGAGGGGGGGGVGSVTGATGGGGGNGAGGNGGGGGTGGSSVGVLYKGKPPTISGATVSDVPTASYFSGATVADNGGPPGAAGPVGQIGAHVGNPGQPGAKGRSGFTAAVREVK